MQYRQQRVRLGKIHAVVVTYAGKLEVQLAGQRFRRLHGAHRRARDQVVRPPVQLRQVPRHVLGLAAPALVERALEVLLLFARAFGVGVPEKGELAHGLAVSAGVDPQLPVGGAHGKHGDRRVGRR